jgi:hypothetical protein
LYRIRVVTPSVDRVVQQVILAGHVISGACVTMPVFTAIVWIRIISINHICAVHHVTTVWGWWWFCHTTIVAFIANWTVFTLNIFWIITPLSVRFEEQVILTNHMLNVQVTHAIPVFTTIVGIRVEAFT